MANDTSRTKQLALSSLVILTFIAYSANQRGEKSDDGHVSAPRPQAIQGASPSTSHSVPSSVTYKDGRYTGIVADAFYGNIQVQVTIQGGKITDLQFLQYPHDNPNSININQQAMPFLKQEAIAGQSGHVDIVSGATDTSQAFNQSLSSALAKAQ